MVLHLKHLKWILIIGFSCFNTNEDIAIESHSTTPSATQRWRCKEESWRRVHSSTCDQHGLCVWPHLAPSDTSWGHSKAQYQCALHSGTCWVSITKPSRGKAQSLVANIIWAWTIYLHGAMGDPGLSLASSHTQKYLAFHLSCCLPSISQQCSHWGAHCWSAARACCLFAGLSCLSCYVGHQESDDPVYIHRETYDAAYIVVCVGVFQKYLCPKEAVEHQLEEQGYSLSRNDGWLGAPALTIIWFIHKHSHKKDFVFGNINAWLSVPEKMQRKWKSKRAAYAIPLAPPTKIFGFHLQPPQSKRSLGWRNVRWSEC